MLEYATPPAESSITGTETPPIVIRKPLNVRNAAVTVLMVLAAILVLQYAEPVLIPIILAILIAYVLAPAVTALERRGLPRVLGAALVIVLLCGGLAYSAYVLSDQAMAILDNVPRAAARLSDSVREHRQRPDGPLQKVQLAAAAVDMTAATIAETPREKRGVRNVDVVEPLVRANDYLWAGGIGLVTFLGQFAAVIFLVFFLLVTGDLFKRKAVRIAGPTLTKKKITVQIMDEINLQIGNFLRVQVVTSAIVGVATALVLWWLGLDQFIVWGLLAGVFNSIPYLGPVIVTGGLGLVAFMQFDDLLRTAWVCGAALAITSLEGWLLTPALMSRASQMNAVVIFVGLLFWSWVWGVWGAILAVPMLMMLKAVCDRVEDLQPIGELLGE